MQSEAKKFITKAKRVVFSPTPSRALGTTTRPKRSRQLQFFVPTFCKLLSQYLEKKKKNISMRKKNK